MGDPRAKQILAASAAEVAAMAVRGVRVLPGEWAQAIGDVRVLAAQRSADPEWEKRLKQLDTYAEPVRLAALTDPAGRVRATWNLNNHRTGRICPSHPPLQAITKQGALRSCVVPAEGRLFVVADWSMSQARVAAHLSGDTVLLDALGPGRDLYSVMGAAIAPKSPDQRTIGKVFHMALLYRAGNPRLVKTGASVGLTLSHHDAWRIRAWWTAAAPQLFAWQQSQKGCVEIITPLGRRASLPPGSRYLNAVLAWHGQAWEADALRIVLSYTNSQMPAGAEVVLIVHDEVIWEVPAELAPEAAVAAGELMRMAMKAVCPRVHVAVKVECRESWGGPDVQSWARQ